MEQLPNPTAITVAHVAGFPVPDVNVEIEAVAAVRSISVAGSGC